MWFQTHGGHSKPMIVICMPWDLSGDWGAITKHQPDFTLAVLALCNGPEAVWCVDTMPFNHLETAHPAGSSHLMYGQVSVKMTYFTGQSYWMPIDPGQYTDHIKMWQLWNAAVYPIENLITLTGNCHFELCLLVIFHTNTRCVLLFIFWSPWFCIFHFI